MNADTVHNEGIRLHGSTVKTGPLLIFAGLLLLGLSIALASGEGWITFWKAYLAGWMASLGIVLGSLFFVILQHITRSGWSVSVRRLAEGIASNLRWMWMLFVPILILVLSGNGALLYQWADVELVAHDHLLQQKSAYLSPTFWSIRAIVYLLVWVVLGTVYLKWSTNQDRDGDVKWTHKMQKWAPLGIIAYAFTQSYAAIDWMMTLQPKWFSTMFAVYYFAATMAGFFSFIILFARYMQRTGHLKNEITTEHYHDLGKWLFGLGVVFWAYIGFSQYMLIWYANLPVETSWYMTRQMGGWRAITLLLLFGHFLIPFVLLITRWTKRWRFTLPLIASWLLFMFFVDICWIVLPVVPEAAIADATSYNQLFNQVASGEVSVGYGWSILNLTCLVGMVSLVWGGTLLNLKKCNLIATADPRLGEALHFENM